MSEYDDYFLYRSIGQYPEKQERLYAVLTWFPERWSAGGSKQWLYAEAIKSAYLKKWGTLLNATPG